LATHKRGGRVKRGRYLQGEIEGDKFIYFELAIHILQEENDSALERDQFWKVIHLLDEAGQLGATLNTFKAL